MSERIISFSADCGQNGYLGAAIKAQIAIGAKAQVIDLYHSADPYHIEDLAYHIIGALHTFPDHSFHIVLSNYTQRSEDILVYKFRDQYLLAPDYGLMSLIEFLDYSQPICKYKIENTGDVLASVSNYLRCIEDLTQQGMACCEVTRQYVQTKPLNMGLSIRSQLIIARIFYINPLGHLVLNIRQKEFEEAIKDQPFQIWIHSLVIENISKSYYTEDKNRIGAIFGSAGFLELFMVGDHLGRLLNFNTFTNNKIEIKIGDDPNRQINF